MPRMRAFIVVLCCALVTAGIARGAAAARGPTPKVTLQAARNLITYGEKVKVGGVVKPRTGGQKVNIVADGRIIASDITNRDGRYAVHIKPGRNRTLRAQWAAAVSKRELVRVKPRVRAWLEKVRIFDKARIHGKVSPAQEGRRIKVKLVTRERTIATKRVNLRNGRSFATRLPVRSISPVQARAIIDPPDYAPGRDGSSYKDPNTPYLSEGARGPLVKVVERRLKSLGYRVDVDWSFEFMTSDALIAFHKVQGLPRIDDVADYTWRALVHPRRPKPVSKSGYHFEVDQTKQVLYIVRKGTIRTIVHVSTGANGATRDGIWTVHRQLDGYSGGGLYYPSYFDGARAVHGWRSVPTYPASHGCVRTPMWIAPWLNDRAYIGMTVRVYHS